MTVTVALVNLECLSDGELMELAVPSNSMNRRVLVIWMYLKVRSQIPVDEFEQELTASSEKELQRRANSAKT